MEPEIEAAAPAPQVESERRAEEPDKESPVKLDLGDFFALNTNEEDIMYSTLYSERVIDFIRKQRIIYESRTDAACENWEAFQEYIGFETMLLERFLNESRERITSLPDTDVNCETIEKTMMARINTIYNRAMKILPDQLTPMASFYAFCHKYTRHDLFDLAMDRIIELCSSQPTACLLAADHYFKNHQDMYLALDVLHEGRKHHSNSKLIWKALIYVNTASATNDINEAECCIQLQKYINTIFEEEISSHFDLLLELLKILEAFPITICLQVDIMNKLIERFNDSKLLWSALAKRDKRHFKRAEKNSNEEHTQAEYLQRYRDSFVRIQSLDAKKKIWKFFIQNLVIAWSRAKSAKDIIAILGLLGDTFRVGFEEMVLNEEHIIMWIGLQKIPDGLLLVEEVLERYPDTLILWEVRFWLLWQNNNMGLLTEVFQSAKLTLKEKALPLWLYMLSNYKLIFSQHAVESLYCDGIMEIPAVANTIKCHYLRWVAYTKGIQKARVLYYQFMIQEPHYNDIHVTMSDIESEQAKVNYDTWRHVHEMACTQLGKTNPDVWMNYIKYHLHYRGKDHQAINRIVQRAAVNLPPEVFEAFKLSCKDVYEIK